MDNLRVRYLYQACVMCQVGGVKSTVSPPLRRSPLSRQPVLTHHHRRHVVVSKSTSLPTDCQVTRSRDASMCTSESDHDHKPVTDSKSRTLEEHSQIDADDDAVWLENVKDLASESAIFMPGRLLGTSDSFYAKSLRDMPRDSRTERLQMSVDQNAEGSLSASCSELRATSVGSHGEGDHGDASADGSADALDEEHREVITSSPSAPFVRETHRRRRQNLRRPVTDLTSE